jgi:hypothetical protein
MPSTQRSALGRLLHGLKREQHDYQASLELFPALNIDKLADDMGLATLGADRGAREEPASDRRSEGRRCSERHRGRSPTVDFGCARRNCRDKRKQRRSCEHKTFHVTPPYNQLAG